MITEAVAPAVGVAEFKGRALQLLVQGHPGSWALQVLGKVSLPLDLFLTAEPHLQRLTVIVKSGDVHPLPTVWGFSAPLYLHLCL